LSGLCCKSFFGTCQEISQPVAKLVWIDVFIISPIAFSQIVPGYFAYFIPSCICMHLLKASSVVFTFLKFDVITSFVVGRNSTFYMKDIVLKLAEIFVHAAGDERKTCHVSICIILFAYLYMSVSFSKLIIWSYCLKWTRVGLETGRLLEYLSCASLAHLSGQKSILYPYSAWH